MKKKLIIIKLIILLAAVTAIVLSVMRIANKTEKATVDINVPNYYSLSEFYFDGDFNEFYKDIYDWYKSIENEDGVYIINTSYYDDVLLKEWAKNKIYKTVPEESFWYFTASPSYLEQIGISLSEEYINTAHNGTRLYMIPNTLSENAVEAMTAYLKEDAVKNAETSNIKTTFTANQEVKIITYNPKDSYFTWPYDKEQPITEKAPVIYVCTSENMKYYESESLISTGVDSYIKFENEENVKKYTENNEVKKYSLKFLKSSEIYKNASKAKLVDRKTEKIFAE